MDLKPRVATPRSVTNWLNRVALWVSFRLSFGPFFGVSLNVNLIVCVCVCVLAVFGRKRKSSTQDAFFDYFHFQDSQSYKTSHFSVTLTVEANSETKKLENYVVLTCYRIKTF